MHYKGHSKQKKINHLLLKEIACTILERGTVKTEKQSKLTCKNVLSISIKQKRRHDNSYDLSTS